MFNSKISFFSILLLIAFHIHELRGMGTDMVPLVISRSPSRTAATEESIPAARIEGFADQLEEVRIVRSPSTSRDMPDFMFYVEQRVTEKESAEPEKYIYLDFGTKLLNLFQRLQETTDEVRTQWKTAFHILSTGLARNHHVRGVKLEYNDLDDMPMAAALIEPFQQEEKLQRVMLTPAAIRPMN